MNPLYGAVPGVYVPMWVTFGALVTHRYTYACPLSKTSQYLRTFNTICDPVFDGVRLACFKSVRGKLWAKTSKLLR